MTFGTIMGSIWAFIIAHQIIATLIVVQAILALPMPDATSGSFYRWFFAFMSAIPSILRSGASMGRAGQKAPEPPKPPDPPKP